MTDFLNLLLDPTAGNGGGIGGSGPQQFAPDDQPSLPPEIAEAYNHVLRRGQPQQPAASFEQRWTAWGSAFGGYNTTTGNSTTGSANFTASDYGFAAGMTYHADAATSYGFALSGGGTNWNLAGGLGGGRSDAFQAGVYGTTHYGPLYLSGALAFANHWFSTNRIAVGDSLTASFQGQSYAARGEAGYRYGVPVTGTIIGVTPYAALQVQTFHTPGYSETDLSGGGFGLTYNAMSATDTRSELGARFDNLTVWNDMPLILRGRLAWAHDWVTNPRGVPDAAGIELHHQRRHPAGQFRARQRSGGIAHQRQLDGDRQVRRRIRAERADLCRHRHVALHVVTAPSRIM
ncbi:MAG: autotransporter outer membrane beta-barrel domain-containing protein [Xanthobacteraceae bacterium]